MMDSRAGESFFFPIERTAITAATMTHPMIEGKTIDADRYRRYVGRSGTFDH
jgi:hypothetical protein